jgi:hypothetical protein
MPEPHEFTEEQDNRILEIYYGKGETAKSAAKKASIELEEAINSSYVYGLLKKRGIAGKKKGRSGVSHEGHFHGNKKGSQVYYSSLTEEMISDVLGWFNEFVKNISAYRSVNESFIGKYGKRLIYPLFEEIIVRSGVDVKSEAYRG